MTPIKMTLTLEKFNTHCEKEVIKYGTKKIDEVYMEILRTSPFRTGKYYRGHRKMPWRKEGSKFIFEVINTDGFPERVEKGFGPRGAIGGRRTKVVWHMKNGGLYYNYGSDTYKKAILKAKRTIGQ